MVFRGVVDSVETDDAGCAWANVDVVVSVDDKPMTECAVRVALPATADDNPWERRGEEWRP